MESAVIIATYNWPRALELALWGFAGQTDRRVRVVVADDGSGPETACLLDRLRGETGLDITHVWHERPWRDEGMVRQNRAHRQVVRGSGASRARQGLAELEGTATVQG